MEENRIFERIFRNWIPKALCLLSALVMYMFYQQTIYSRKTFAVPLIVMDGGAVVPDDDFADFVRVTVRTNSKNISLVNEDTLTAYLNLNSVIDDGIHDIPVSIRLAPEIRELSPMEITVKPSSVPISVKKKLEKYVQIEAAVTGIPAKGYTVTGFFAEPNTVFVSGPDYLVSALDRVYTEKIDVTGASKTSHVTSHLKNDNPYIKMDTNTEVTVTYNIEPTPLTRHFSNIAVAVRNLNESLAVSGDVVRVSFDLNGTELALSNYSPGTNTAYIDCSEISEPGTYEFPIRFALPRGVTADHLNADNVVVTVIAAETVQE